MPLAIQLNKTSEAKKRSLETPEDDKITRENQYQGQMFSSGQRNFLKNVSLIVVMNLINRLYT